MAGKVCRFGCDTPEKLAHLELPQEHLRIGECIFTRRACVVTTVLGSCVSVTFHHAATGTAGIFHAMLPQGKSTRCDEDPCKFADTAVRCIMEKFDALEIPRKEIVCKLFGGGFTVKDKANLDVRSIVDVGKKNVAVAKAELARYGLKPSVDESRGKSGRKLFFVTSTGDVWMRFVGNEENLSSCF